MCSLAALDLHGCSGAALGWRWVRGPEDLSPVWYCWTCPLPSPIQTLLPSSPRGPGVSDCCHLGVLNHLQGTRGGFPVASSSQGCAERMTSGQSSCLAGANAARAIGRNTWGVVQLLGLSAGAVLGVIAALAAVLHTPGWRAGD